ncbi:unnamed protein product [Malus baccata var. baccata]
MQCQTHLNWRTRLQIVVGGVAALFLDVHSQPQEFSSQRSRIAVQEYLLLFNEPPILHGSGMRKHYVPAWGSDPGVYHRPNISACCLLPWRLKH